LTLLFLPDSFALSISNNIISNDGIESVKTGDSVDKVFSVFKHRYQINDLNNPHIMREITISEKGHRFLSFSIDSEGKIAMIDIYAKYRTRENIGCGSTLSSIIKTYGKGHIDPTDEGYYIFFDNSKIKGVQFLLNNNDIPRDLRNIPDDVITNKNETKILSLGKARIVRIRINYIYDDE